MNIPASIKSRFTLGVTVVLLHYIAWRLGVFLMNHDNEVEGFGEHVTFITFYSRWYVVAAVCLYSLARRFALSKHEWDIYGPPLAFLSATLMYLEIQRYV